MYGVKKKKYEHDHKIYLPWECQICCSESILWIKKKNWWWCKGMELIC